MFGTITAVVLGYYLLSEYYSPLFSWFAPYYGGGLSLIFGLFFLLFGNPLTYPVLLAAWIVVGVVVGLAVRRALGSVFSMLMIHVGCLFLMMVGVAAYVLAYSPSLSGILTGTAPIGPGSLPALPYVPPPPVGSNIVTLLTEPVIYQLFQSLLSLLSGGPTALLSSATSSPVSLLTGLVLPLLLPAFLLFLFSALTAAVVAHISQRIVLGLDRKHVARPYRMRGFALTLLALLAVLLLVISGTVQYLPSSPVQVSQSPAPAGPTGQYAGNVAGIATLAVNNIHGVTGLTSDFVSHGATGDAVVNGSTAGYDETSLNLISPDGNMYSSYVFASNYTFPQDSAAGSSQVGLSLLIMSRGVANIPSLASLSGGLAGSSATGVAGISQATLLALMPPELLLISVSQGAMAAQNVAGNQVAYYSSITGDSFMLLAEMSNGSLFGTPLLPGIAPAGSSLFIYGCNAHVSNSAAHLASTYLPSLHPGGLIDSFSAQLSGGSLFAPTAYGSDSALLVVGSAGNSSILGTGGVTAALPFNLFPQGRISFCIGLFYRTDFAFGGGIHTMRMSSLIGYKPFNFSSTAFGSFLGLFSARNYSGFSITSIPSSYNGTVYTDGLPVPNQTVSIGGWTYINQTAQQPFDPNSTVAFTSPLPPYVVLRTVSSVSGSTISVYADVSNLGNSTVSGLSLYFPGITIPSRALSPVTAGSGYRNISALAPGQSFDTNFSVSVSNPGTYVLPSVAYSYSAGGRNYMQQSAATEARVDNSSLVVEFPAYIAGVVSALSARFYPSISPSEILAISYLFPTIFVALGIRAEQNSFRKWKKKRDSLRRLQQARLDEGVT